jgi:hypothetical protein
MFHPAMKANRMAIHHGRISWTARKPMHMPKVKERTKEMIIMIRDKYG